MVVQITESSAFVHFQWSIFYILFNVPQNIDEYHFIWGFRFARVQIKGIRIGEGPLYYEMRYG